MLYYNENIVVIYLHMYNTLAKQALGMLEIVI